VLGTEDNHFAMHCEAVVMGQGLILKLKVAGMQTVSERELD